MMTSRRIVTALAVATLAMTASVAHAHTFTVNSALDELGTGVGSGICETAPGNGVCTLRRAMAEAQAIVNRDRFAQFDIVIWLQLPGGLLQLAPNAAPLTFDVPSLVGPRLAIVGTGKGSTIIDGGGRSVFVLTGGTPSISGLTIRNADEAILAYAYLSLTNVRVADSNVGLRGQHGTFEDCEFLRNRLGAMRLSGAGAVWIRRSTFADNTTTANGGALVLDAVRAELDGVTIARNHADGDGGGIYARGGGIIAVRNSTISGNSAGGSGGGIANLGALSFGVSHSTIADNEADQRRDGSGQGGGVFAGSSMGLDSVIVAHNRQTAMVGGVRVPFPGNCAGSVGVSGSLSTTLDCGAMIVADPLLGPLQDNGGPTPTHALLAGSPAIDAGGCGSVAGEPPVLDQRGYVRPTGSACDIGALELGAAPLPPALPRDLDGDREADVVWRHPATGRSAAWLMDDTTITSGAYLTPVSDPRWDVVGSGDFDADADGYGDLLWRRDSGQVVVWFMFGPYVREAVYLPILEDLSWRLAGTGDFDADSRTDILWQKDDGQLLLWLVDGWRQDSAALKAAVRLPYPRDPGWQVLGVGDADGDRKADILWRQDFTGTNAIWLMNGATIVSGHYLPEMADPGWRFVAFADWEGDGHSDVIWRTTDGAHLGIWYLAGGNVIGRESAGLLNGSDWRVVAPVARDTGGARLLLRRISDGQLAYFPPRGTLSPTLLPTPGESGWEPR